MNVPVVSWMLMRSGVGGVTPPPLPDYTTNLWEEFVASQGIIADANNLDIDSWTGYRNGIQLNATATTEDIPVNGAINLTVDGQGFTISNSNPNVGPTDCTFFYLFQKNSAHAETNGIWIFDNLSPVPRLIIKFEISAANTNVGLQKNGVDYDFGVAFPFGASKTVMAVRISNGGTEATLHFGGVQVGNTLTGLTGGQFAMDTAVTTRRFLRGASTITRTYKGKCEKIRLYVEAVSDANIALISDPANAFYNPVTVNNVRLFNGVGQSLESGSGAWGSLPANLTGVISRCFLWNNNLRKFEALSSVLYTLSTPMLSFCYEQAQKYPNDDIMFIMGAVGGTNMASWSPPLGARYLANKGWCDAALLQLQIQMRTIVDKGGHWNHGQTDAQNAGLSAVYGTEELPFITQWKSDFGHTTIASALVREDLPAPATLANIQAINAGKVANAAIDTDINVFIDTFEISGDNIHHTTAGNIDLGEKQSEYF